MSLAPALQEKNGTQFYVEQFARKKNNSGQAKLDKAQMGVKPREEQKPVSCRDTGQTAPNSLHDPPLMRNVIRYRYQDF